MPPRAAAGKASTSTPRGDPPAPTRGFRKAPPLRYQETARCGGRGPPERSAYRNGDHGGYRLYRSAPIGPVAVTERIQSLDPNSRFPKVRKGEAGRSAAACLT